MKTDLTEITKEVRDKTGVDLETVRKYSRFMFKIVADTMKAGAYESIGLQYLGTFHVKDARLWGLHDKGVDIGEKGRKRVEQFRKDKYGHNR